MAGKVGRPTKLVPERVSKLLDALRAGNYINVAIVYAGIGQRTFNNWMELGATHKEGKYLQFRQSVEKAQADAEAAQVALIRKAAIDQWQAAAWLLERKHKDRWAQSVRTIVTGENGGPIRLEVEARAKLFGIIVNGATRLQSADDIKQIESVKDS